KQLQDREHNVSDQMRAIQEKRDATIQRLQASAEEQISEARARGGREREDLQGWRSNAVQTVNAADRDLTRLLKASQGQVLTEDLNFPRIVGEEVGGEVFGGDLIARQGEIANENSLERVKQVAQATRDAIVRAAEQAAAAL